MQESSHLLALNPQSPREESANRVSAPVAFTHPAFSDTSKWTNSSHWTRVDRLYPSPSTKYSILCVIEEKSSIAWSRNFASLWCHNGEDHSLIQSMRSNIDPSGLQVTTNDGWTTAKERASGNSRMWWLVLQSEAIYNVGSHWWKCISEPAKKPFGLGL